MELGSNLELHVPSVPGFEKVAMDFVASVAKMMKLPDDRIEDLKTAVAEACINAIEHGNSLDASIKVGISLTVEDAKLQVAVRDEGTGIGQINPPSIERTLASKKRPRGWGIFLIKNLMDEVEFETTPGKGNVVRMVIHLDQKARPLG
jgi:serine/threonine-protein kinase RsbW